MENTVFAGKYRVLRRIGEGGGGQVWEAMHVVTGRPVALKVMRSPFFGPPDEESVRRFEREARATGGLASPHIVSIFDAGRDDEGTPFLAMELLCGEDVQSLLRREGRLAPAAAVTLVLEACRGLEVAHAAGIIHRDIKPANLFVTITPAVPVLKILDFGTAKLLGRAEDLALTQLGGVLGSPLYMSPEQLLEAGAIDVRSDVWSLGVVLYELLAGRAPFAGAAALPRLIVQITQEEAPPLASVAPDVPPALVAVVERALRRDVDERFSSVGAFRAALEAVGLPAAHLSVARLRVADAAPVVSPAATTLGTLPAPAETVAAITPVHRRAAVPGRRLWRVLVPGLAAALLLVGALWLRGREPRPLATPGRRPSVAIITDPGLGAHEGVTLAWPTAIAELLADDLALGEALRALPTGNVTELAAAASAGATPSKEAAAALGRASGADYVLVVRRAGEVTASGRPRVHAETMLLRVLDGARLEASAVERDDLVALVRELGDRTRHALGIPSVAATGPTPTLPADAEAARLYAEGVLHLRRTDAEAARERFEAVVARAPEFAPAHEKLADAWLTLRYDSKAVVEARRAFELAEALPREERLRLEGYYRKITREWGRAREIFTALCTFFPDEPAYRLGLAHVFVHGGEPRRGLEEAERLVALGPGPYLAQALTLRTSALQKLSRGTDLLESARELQRVAAARGARRVVGDGSMFESLALRSLNRADEADAALDRAEALYTELRDRRGLGWVMTARFRTALEAGETAGARTRGAALVAFYRDVGDPYEEAGIHNSLGNSALRTGNLPEAKSEFALALELYRTTQSAEGIANVAGNLGLVLRGQGDLAGASPLLEESAEGLARLGSRTNAALAFADLCSFRLARGFVEGAREACRTSAAHAESASSPEAIRAHAHAELELLRETGEADAARAFVQNRFPDGGPAADGGVELGLAELEGDQQRFAGALAHATLAEALLRKEDAGSEVALALATRARWLAKLGRIAEAVPLFEEARAILAPLQHVEHTLWVDLAHAEVMAAAGQRAAATEEAERVATRAKAAGFVLLELHARLLQGAVAQRRASLVRWGSTARAAGLVRLARVAEEAARRSS